MRRLLTGHAVVFNLRHQRSGHLFQNRYKSIVCEEDTYLLDLIRYIHLNPLRAGLVTTMDELDSYQWCCHAVLMGKQELEGQRADAVLLLFNRNKRSAREKYRVFVTDGIRNGQRDDLLRGGQRRFLKQMVPGEYEVYDERILGSGDFVERLREEVASLTVPSPLVPLDRIMQHAAAAFGIQADLLSERRRDHVVADARATTCYLAVRRYGHSGVEVAKALNISRSGVSVAVQRGAEFMRAKPTLLEELINNSTT
jgi:hypothetical protein